MMFLFWKYAKLKVFLICVHKPKTTNKLKRREYYLSKSLLRDDMTPNGGHFC